jgi:hypothetical protein
MRFSIPLLCMLGSSIAAPVSLVARDTAIVEVSIRSVQASLQNLATLIKNLDGHGGPKLNDQIAMITHHGEELSSTTRRGTNDIHRAPNVGLTEAPGLLPSVQGLLDATSRAIDAWIASKAIIVRSGGKDAVRRILENQKVDSQNFQKALLEKLPYAIGVTLGQSYASSVVRSIDKGISAFR